jgi:hypothetical protein
MSDVPPNVLRRAAGLDERSPTSGEALSGLCCFDGNRLRLKSDVEAERVAIRNELRIFADKSWTPNFDYAPGDRIKAGRPRFRRARRALAGWLERVAGEIRV